MKRFLAIMLTLLFLLALSPAQALAADSAAGIYKLFTMEMSGKEMDPAALGLEEGSFSFYEDGTGKFTINGEDQILAAWSVDGNTITASDAEGNAETLLLEDGVIEMELGGGAYLYFAREGKDVSDYKLSGHSTGSKVAALYKSVDASKGAHLDYEYHSDYMDSTSIFDVQAKGGCFYSLRTTKASGYENLSATLYKDGKTYVLYPDEKRGNLAVTISSSLLEDNILVMDELFKEIYQCAFRRDFSEEKRELDGVSYTAEIYPAADYTPETVFYFDDTGRLVHVLVGAPVIMPDLGETFYTVREIDDAVNEAVFDISGYEITE